jgi:hypothetical protein
MASDNQPMQTLTPREYLHLMAQRLEMIYKRLGRLEAPDACGNVQAYTREITSGQDQVQTFLKANAMRVGYAVYNNSGGENLLLSWATTTRPAPDSAPDGPFWSYNLGDQQMHDRADLGYLACPKGELLGRWETSNGDEEAFITEYVLER